MIIMKQFTINSGNNPENNNNLYLFTEESTLENQSSVTAFYLKTIKAHTKKKVFTFNDEHGFSIFIKAEDTAEKVRKQANAFFNQAKEAKAIEWNFHLLTTTFNFAFTEGFLLSTYAFEKYLTKKTALNYTININAGLNETEIKEVENIALGTFTARTLVNEPHSFLNATQYSLEIERLSKEFGFDFNYLTKDKIEEMKMGGVMAVNKGSVQQPTFNILEYKSANAKNKKPIVLVGKGVMFDTGGLSLKPTANSMDFMKSDMGGSAAVVGAFCAIAAQKLDVHVIGLIPATDNRPGLDAVVPGDVITMYSGKTVEVLNTDAEGRLVLADALHYAKQYEPELVMDFATLTGAAAAAIGPVGVVCMGNAPESTKEDLKTSGFNVHERLVEFPMWDEYEPLIKSDIADIKNLGGPYGGAITAGMFLQHFVDYNWMHFDIAGAAFLKSPDSYRGQKGTGVGVRLIYDFLKNRSTQNAK